MLQVLSCVGETYQNDLACIVFESSLRWQSCPQIVPTPYWSSVRAMHGNSRVRLRRRRKPRSVLSGAMRFGTVCFLRIYEMNELFLHAKEIATEILPHA